MRSLNTFRHLRNRLIAARRNWLMWAKGIAIHPSVSISLSAKFVPGAAGGISIGEHTLIAFKTLIIARDANGTVRPIRIGRNCFIGGNSVILPGVTVGNGSIVGAGAIVDRDVPAGTIVGGNPAIVLRDGIVTSAYGCLVETPSPEAS